MLCKQEKVIFSIFKMGKLVEQIPCLKVSLRTKYFCVGTKSYFGDQTMTKKSISGMSSKQAKITFRQLETLLIVVQYKQF